MKKFNWEFFKKHLEITSSRRHEAGSLGSIQIQIVFSFFCMLGVSPTNVKRRNVFELKCLSRINNTTFYSSPKKFSLKMMFPTMRFKN